MKDGEVEGTKSRLDRAPGAEVVTGWFIGTVAGWRLEVAWKIVVVLLLSISVWRLWVIGDALDRQVIVKEVERPAKEGN